MTRLPPGNKSYNCIYIDADQEYVCIEKSTVHHYVGVGGLLGVLCTAVSHTRYTSYVTTLPAAASAPAPAASATAAGAAKGTSGPAPRSPP